MSVAKVFFFIADYWIGYLTQIVPAMQRSQLIVFDRYPGPGAQLWIMDSDGRDLHSLVSSADADSEVPSWSRDGKSIYFASRGPRIGAAITARLT